MEQRTYGFNSLGFALSYKAPVRASDIESLTGQPGCCEEAYMLNFYCYQDRGPVFREKFTEALIAATGEARKVKIEKVEGKADKTSFDETEQAYLNRIYASQVLPESEIAAIAIRINEEIGDWVPTSASRSGKPSKPFYDAADGLLGKIAAGAIGGDGQPATAEKTQALIEAKLKAPFETLFGEFNRDNLARALKELRERADREAANLV